MDKDDETDDEVAVDDYLVQNVKTSEEIKSPEVATIKQRQGELEALKQQEEWIRPLKIQCAGTYITN